MNLRLAFVVLSSAACVTWGFVGCGGGDDSSQQDAGDDGTTGNDGSQPPDTGTGNDTGTGSDTGTGNDGSSGGLSFTCGFGPDAGTVNDCSQCQGFPIPCVFCEVADASVLQGRCGSVNGGCNVNGTSSFAACPCSGDASACPESFQVCRMGNGNTHACHTCGEQQTNTLTCENGGTCNAADGGCN